MKKLFFALFIVAVASASAFSQKFGYVHTGELLAALPEVAQADTDLEAFQNELVSQGQAMVTEFETAYRAYMEAANSGALSKVQMAEREGILSQEQEKIANYEKEVQLKVLQKREELLQPILEKIDGAIQDIGQEGGYTFIFDAGMQGAMLYAPESENLIDVVKAKLGL